MTVLPGSLRRLVGRSPRELVGRLTQVARAELERLGIGGQEPSASAEHLLAVLTDDAPGGGPEELLARFRARAASGPLAAFRDPAHTLAALREAWPDSRVRALARARRVEAGRFDLLGYRGLDFGDPIDWQLEPVHALRAPEAHWSRVPYLDPSAVGDHKVVWELNRHQYLTDVGRAYWHTGDERWPRLFAAHVEAWMDANPPKRGINWTSSLELAFRAISWLWALHFFARSPSLTPELFLRMASWLRVKGAHVERYISTYFSPNTHLTGEALALVYLGTCLPELPEASRWVERGTGWLRGALDTQIRPDGGYFEGSTHYHRYTADFYLHLLLLGPWEDASGRDAVRERVEPVIDHLAALTRPDGRTVQIGDEDGGKLLFLDDRPLSDFRSTLLTGALIFERPDWAFVAGDPTEELVWLHGPDARARLADLGATEPSYRSRALPETGIFVIRSGWDERADHCTVRCGPHGALSGGHAHADALSIEITAGGVPILVEAGTGAFMDAELRDELRATASHNTVSVGGRSSAEPGGPFAWATTADGRLERWIARDSFAFFRGAHDGFARLSPGLVHDRSLLWVRDWGWAIRDRLSGTTDAEARAHFKLAPGLSAEERGPGVLRVRDAGGTVAATLYALDGTRWESHEARVSTRYGRLEGAQAWTRSTAAPAREIWTAIVPGDGPDFEPIAMRGGRAWSIGGDLLAVGAREAAGDDRDRGDDASAVSEDGALDTDFAWLWLRPDRDGLGWRCAVGIDGRRARFGSGATVAFPALVSSFSLTPDGTLEAEGADGSAVAGETETGAAVRRSPDPLPNGRGD